tara:strand:- start:330 stop:704 length:375 start_codon:yes stop_codon:yes gene_type:complete
MSEKDEQQIEKDSGIKSAFSPGKTTSSGTLFAPEEFDIYVNKITMEAYIFHAIPVKQDISRLEYNPKDHSVTVVKKDGTQMDLGAKVQWLVRPYFTKAREVGIVQTKDGEILDGFMVPIIHKEK